MGEKEKRVRSHEMSQAANGELLKCIAVGFLAYLLFLGKIILLIIKVLTVCYKFRQ